MSNQTEVQNQSGGVSPSSYTIKKAELFPSNKSKPVDIRQMIMKLDFIESLGQPYIECVAFLQDAGNFLSTLKLISFSFSFINFPCLIILDHKS